METLSARVHQELSGGQTLDGLYASGLLDVIGADGDVVAYTRGISALEAALRQAPDSAELLADIAAAYLLRADAGGEARDYFVGLEDAAWALERNPRDAVARFNLALALDRVGAPGEAEQEWRRYLALVDTGQMADEVRARIRALQADTALTLPAPDAPGAAAALARVAPQRARELATDSLLPAWGEATLRGQRERAESLLRRADELGSALASRGGDRSVAAEVAAIRKAAARGAVADLASAHAAYGEGMRFGASRRFQPALRAFRRAGRRAGASPVLRQWARCWEGITLFYEAKPTAAMPLFLDVASSVDTVLTPALAARNEWSMGTLAGREERFPDALTHSRRAQALFARTGERENRGAARFGAVAALSGVGKPAEAYGEIVATLQILRPYRGSLRTHTALYESALHTGSDGLVRAAIRLQDEDVRVAAHLPSGSHAEALLARARALIAAGRLDEAQRDVDQARPLIPMIPTGSEHGWAQADLTLDSLRLVRAQPSVKRVRTLDAVVRLFRAQKAGPRLVPAMMQRAEVRLALGDTANARSDLGEVTGFLRARSQAISVVELRASMLEAARSAFERLTMLHVHAGRPREALLALEAGRSVLASGGGSATPPTVAPPGEAWVSYGLIGDTLLAWVVTPAGVHMERRTLDRAALVRRIDAARQALEAPEPSSPAQLESRLESLHDELVSPLREWIPPGSRLVVIADGEVGAAPFPALRQRSSGRYLLQDFPLSFAASLADAAPGTAARAPGDRPLFVADPQLPAELAGVLQPLPQTRAAVKSIAQRYPGATTLTGREATPAAVFAALGRASLFHFAGHAVFDDEHPERSYLVLAGTPGNADGRVTAAELEGKDLRRLRLVVLSACETQRSVSGRTGGFAGLTAALLAAGAGGVIGSTWSVDEASTRDLMGRFHDAYRQGTPPADALRNAQLAMLASRDPRLSSPAAWAGFRYAGH